MSKKINKILKTRDLLFCYQKVAEELFELGEIVMKQINKPIGAEDRINHLTEELGDVIFNIKLLSSKLNIEDNVKKRVKTKLNSLL